MGDPGSIGLVCGDEDKIEVKFLHQSGVQHVGCTDPRPLLWAITLTIHQILKLIPIVLGVWEGVH